MPFIPHTPEALIARSDSKNPAATCRGLTSAGRPCRRAIAQPPTLSRTERTRYDPEAYCWQHKDQITAPAPALSQGLQSMTIKERTSIDTLIERLGVVNIQERDKRSKERATKIVYGSGHNVSGSQPIAAQLNRRPRDFRGSKKIKASQTSMSIFCCVGIAEDEPVNSRPVRVQTTPGNSARKSKHTTNQSVQEVNPYQSRPRISSAKNLSLPQKISSTSNAHQLFQSRPTLSESPSSKTGELLSFIPGTATPQVASLLLAELAKPLSIHDEEGYIYIFWLTPTSLPLIPSSEIASSLLAPPASRPAQGRRKTSEILDSFSHTSGYSDNRNKSKSILLKIGRASNVHRRLNEWSRQCGHNLSLIRYYPYSPSTSSSPPARSLNSNNDSSQYFPNDATTPNKVPHVHRIERLIHIELTDQRAKESGRCTSCGSAHREWFEVNASKEGIRSVDEVVRRWVSWGVRQGS